MALTDVVDKEKPEENKKESKQNKRSEKRDKRELETISFLRHYCSNTGKYRGPNPPKKKDKLQLDPESDSWDERWIDKTGDFYEVMNGLSKAVDCFCGEVAWGGNRARYVRCFVCSRVFIDLKWEDDRYGNPRLKEKKTLSDY